MSNLVLGIIFCVIGVLGFLFGIFVSNFFLSNGVDFGDSSDSKFDINGDVGYGKGR